MNISDPAIMQPVFGAILAAYTQPPFEGTKPPSQASETFLSKLWPGKLLDDSYRRPWSPFDTQGSQAATENISRLVNVIPAFASAYADSGGTVEDAYSNILLARAMQPRALLRGNVPKLNSNVLLELAVRDEVSLDNDTTLYTFNREEVERSKLENAYANASAAFNLKRMQYDLSKPAEAAEWERIGPSLESAVKEAWNALQAVQAPAVASAMASLDTSPLMKRSAAEAPTAGEGSSNPIDRSFLAANNLFDKSKMSSSWQPLLSYHPSYLSPGDFMEQTAIWPTFSTPAGGTGLKYFMRFTRVDITRPWMMMSIINMRGWQLQGYPPGSFSSGSSSSNEGSFPLLPTSIIFVKDLWIRDSGDQMILNSPGLQIIAWMNKVVPYLPPAS
jgi:hypothetical protein